MNQKLYRSHKYKMISGFCAGIALQRGWPISLVRLAVIGMSFLTGIVTLAYLIAWFIVPSSLENPDFDKRTVNDTFFRSRKGALLGGLCVAVAKHFDWDVSVVRLFYVILSLMGGGLIIGYVFAWILIPVEAGAIEIESRST